MPFVYMMCSVLSWSLFPLISILGIENIAVADYIFWTYVIGLSATWVLLLILPGRKRMQLPRFLELDWRTKGEISVGCLTALLSFACLLISYSYVSKISATVVYEVWPIIAMYIAPLMIKKGWEKISPKDLIFSVFAFAGIVFLLYPERNEIFFDDLSKVKSYYYLCLPLLGGVFMAVASMMKARVSHKLENKDHPVASLLKVQLFFSTGVALCALPWMLFWPDKQSVYTPGTLMAVAFIGIFIHTLGNVSYTLAILRSARANIAVLWYFMPIFAVVWLWWAGQGEITANVVIGALFIITANLIMTVKADRSLAYSSTIIAMLCCGVYAYYVPGQAMDDYYQAVSVPIVFFTIFVAFMMDRLIRRDQAEEDLAMQIIGHIEQNAASPADRDIYIGQTVAILRTSDPIEIDRHYQFLRNSGNAALQRVNVQLDQLALSKARNTSFGELFILCVLGLLTVAALLVYRPDILIADIFAVVLSFTIMFIFFMVIDLAQERRQFHLDFSAGIARLSSALTENLAGERVISAMLIMLILGAVIGLLWMKHQVF